MGLLDGLLNTALDQLGNDAAGGLGELIQGQGGLGGLVERFQQGGLGEAVGTWVAQGANAAISPEQIRAVIGEGPVAEFAERLGVDPDQAATTLAGLLPEAVDRLTPEGQLPTDAGGLADLLGGLLRR